MIYIYENKNCIIKPWYIPFNNLNIALINFFKQNNINCKYLDTNDNPSEKDIIIAITGIIKSESDINKYKCKVIIINSEPIIETNSSNNFLSKYINNPNIIQIWDYSIGNINKLKKITSIPCYYVPITYDLTFEKNNYFNNKIKKDIDIAFYGNPSGEYRRRRFLINKLKKIYNVSCISTNNINELLNKLYRSKIVIIIHFYEQNFCIDYYRLHLLISNKILTINETPSDDRMDNSMDKLIFSNYNNFIETCDKYLSMTQEERDKISEDTYQWWKSKHKFIDKIPKTIFNLNK